MPLPKPSKMVSKQFKKPQTLKPSIKPPPPSHHKLIWPRQRKWRVRVICTDPDATDDSSADEFDSPTSSPSPRKCSIREIFLPVSPSSLSQPGTPETSSHTQRGRRSVSSDFTAQSKRLCCRDGDPDAIAQDSIAQFDDMPESCIGNACSGRSLVIPQSKCGPLEEEFSRFLTEFVTDIGEVDAWTPSAMPSPPLEDEIADMLSLELDSEALQWINSLQRPP